MEKISKELRVSALEAARKLRANMTNSEKLLWQEVRNNKLDNHKFYRQKIFFISLFNKQTFYIADFYCHTKKLVVEIDGKYHEKQKEKDQIRDMVMRIYGLKVLRFNNEEIAENIEICLDRISKA